MQNFTEIKLPSSYDGLELSCCLTRPDGEIKGVVQLVHGMTEHKERYLPFMLFLAQKGYAVIIHDHRGHGASVKSPDDLGWFYEGGADSVVADIKTVNDYVHTQFEGLPVILLGHSMGSLAVRCFTARYDDCINALVVMGTPANNPAADAGIALAKLDSLLHGKRNKSTLLNNMAFGTYNKNFKDEGHEFSWLNTDLAEVEKYEKDDLCGFLFTNDGWLTLFGLLKTCFNPKGYRLANPKLPILFVSGSDDPCHGGQRSFTAAVGCMVKAGYQNVKAKLYPGMRHEILLAPQHEAVYADILTFLNNHHL